MIDFDFNKISEKKDNKFHPELVTEILWASTTHEIIEDCFSRYGPPSRYRIFENGKEIGRFNGDYGKSLKKQIEQTINYD